MVPISKNKTNEAKLEWGKGVIFINILTESGGKSDINDFYIKFCRDFMTIEFITVNNLYFWYYLSLHFL